MVVKNIRGMQSGAALVYNFFLFQWSLMNLPCLIVKRITMSQSLEMHKRAFQVGRLWGGKGEKGVDFASL